MSFSLLCKSHKENQFMGFSKWGFWVLKSQSAVNIEDFAKLLVSPLFLIMFLIYFTHRHYFCLTRWYLNFTGTTISSIFLVFYGNIPCRFMEDAVHWKKVQYYNDSLKSKLSLPKIQNREKVSIKFITKPKIKMWLKP